MHDHILQVVNDWQSQGLVLLPGHTKENVRDLIDRVHQPVSEDVLYLYSLCGGMLDGDLDKHWFELWPLERCLREHSSSPSSLFPFAAGFGAAYVYWLKPNDSATSAVFIDGAYPGDPPSMVAPTLDEAFRHLLNNPKKLELP